MSHQLMTDEELQARYDHLDGLWEYLTDKAQDDHILIDLAPQDVKNAIAGVNNEMKDIRKEQARRHGGDIPPKIICLCGSTRFSEAYQQANLEETLAGNIVLTIGCDMRSDAALFADKTETELEQIKADLDRLHLRKIDLADEVLILNVGGYIGSSTRRELEYARASGKSIRFLEAD